MSFQKTNSASQSREPTRTSMVSQGRRKVHTSFPDGSQMVEEFDLKTDILLVRKSRKKTTLGRELPWVFEVGAPETKKAFDPENDLFAEANENPVFSRQDEAEAFCWRVRNIPYPLNVYSVTCDLDSKPQQLVIRTSNRKYFKRITISEVNKIGEKLDAKKLMFSHRNNTLVVRYAKSRAVLELEQAERVERMNLKTLRI